MNYREKMREYLKEPNFLNHHQYGKWGILNREQRQMITRLLDEMDRADIYIKELFFKNEAYENMRKEAIEFIESMEYCGQEDYFYDNKTKDPCGNDNTFNDSKNKLLNILNKVGENNE